MEQNTKTTELIKDFNNTFHDWHFSLAEDGKTINVVMPRDDTFLPPEVSDEYYDAVVNVMEFANCTKEEAIAALEKTNNDIEKAIQIYNPEFECYDN